MIVYFYTNLNFIFYIKPSQWKSSINKYLLNLCLYINIVAAQFRIRTTHWRLFPQRLDSIMVCQNLIWLIHSYNAYPIYKLIVLFLRCFSLISVFRLGIWIHHFLPRHQIISNFVEFYIYGTFFIYFIYLASNVLFSFVDVWTARVSKRFRFLPRVSTQISD